MKYYTFFNSNELDVIGDYPQIEKSENYNLSLPNSYWNVSWKEFPNFEPFYSIKIRNKAKETNMLHSLSGFYGLTIDDNLKALFIKFNLPPHKFYPVEVTHGKKKLNYNWFHFIDSFLDYIDFDKTSFELFQKWPLKIIKVISIDSVKQLYLLQNDLNFEKEIRIKELVLLETFPNYDIISLANITPLILISEKLKIALENSKLNGYSLKEYKLLIV